jgi:hypothetical protein
MTRETTKELRRKLKAAPEDETLRARLARALEAEGNPREAVEVLTTRFVNLTAHDEPTLPCLCKHCLDPELLTAELAGMTFRREFAVTNGRVLFFWVPEQLRHRRAVANAVASRMRDKLRPRRVP